MENVKRYNNLMNEGGEGYTPQSAWEKDAAAHEARFLATWTRETTIERRAKWNGFLAGEKAAGRKVNIVELEKKMGFSGGDLKAAISAHNL